MEWRRFTTRAREWRTELREEASEHIGEGGGWRIGMVVIAVYLAATALLGIYWSREPKLFAVPAVTARLLSAASTATAPAPGSATAAALTQIVATLLDKPGGFISNDVAPPGVWLDNMPNWERGVLRQARDMALVLRTTLGRAPGESARDDSDLSRVVSRLNFSSDSWLLPSSESEYREADGYLRSYLLRLQGSAVERAYFNADAAGLDRWLAQVVLRLGDLSQRLSACVRPHENPALAGDLALTYTVTPSDRVDDIFYEARGSTWALLHLLRAAEIDFADVLRQRGAQTALHQIIRDLEATQEPIRSPLILNGGGFGMLANHSLVMASYVARADATAINLRALLSDQAAPTGADQPATVH